MAWDQKVKINENEKYTSVTKIGRKEMVTKMPIQSFSEHKKIHSHTNKHLLTPPNAPPLQKMTQDKKNNNNAANEKIKYCVVFGDSSSISSSSSNIMSAKAFHIPIVFRSGFTITHTGTDLFLHAH